MTHKPQAMVVRADNIASFGIEGKRHQRQDNFGRVRWVTNEFLVTRNLTAQYILVVLLQLIYFSQSPGFSLSSLYVPWSIFVFVTVIPLMLPYDTV